MVKDKGNHSKSEQDDSHRQDKAFYCKGYIPFLAFVLFGVIFAIIFSVHQAAGKVQYTSMNQKSLAIRDFGSADAQTVMNYFTSYGMYAGVIFGIFTIIISYIIYALARISKWNGAAGVGLLVAYGLFAFYGYEFTFLGPGTVTWANGITAFIGPPLLVSSILMSIIGLVFITLAILNIGNKKGAL